MTRYLIFTKNSIKETPRYIFLAPALKDLRLSLLSFSSHYCNYNIIPSLMIHDLSKTIEFLEMFR